LPDIASDPSPLALEKDMQLAVQLGVRAVALVIAPGADDSTLVFFPTEKETQCGFLMQGPYKTTPSRDNVPHDNKWNVHLVNETAKLIADTLRRIPDLKLASIGLLQAMPLMLEQEIPDEWMFRPVYDAVVETLKTCPLIPAADDRLVSADCARFARGKGLAELFPPKQLSLLFGAVEGVTLDWVSPEISEARRRYELAPVSQFSGPLDFHGVRSAETGFGRRLILRRDDLGTSPSRASD